MAVDTSKMVGLRRRGLGSPPTDGAPGLEITAGDLRAASKADVPPEQPAGREEDGLGEAASSKRRVPAAREEPRIPFTTRITVSTKERLEDACYHLRTKHQAFIDEAIRIHLDKNGF